MNFAGNFNFWLVKILLFAKFLPFFKMECPKKYCETLKNQQKSPKFCKKYTENEEDQFLVSHPPFLADKREIEKNPRNSRFLATHSPNAIIV